MILATEWPFFRNADMERIRQSLVEPVVFDGRNVYKPSLMETMGFDYISIGRDPVMAYSNKKSHQHQPVIA